MSDVKVDYKKLLNDRRVVEEIQRHLWVESEKAGHDIGFEKAKDDWFKNFSKAWMAYHMPETLISPRKVASKKNSPGKSQSKARAQKSKAPQKRRAKAYRK